jgi:hypothetical protein
MEIKKTVKGDRQEITLDLAGPITLESVKSALLEMNSQIPHEQPCAGCRRALKGTRADFLQAVSCKLCGTGNYLNIPPGNITSFASLIFDTETARRKKIATDEVVQEINVRFGEY